MIKLSVLLGLLDSCIMFENRVPLKTLRVRGMLPFHFIISHQQTYEVWLALGAETKRHFCTVSKHPLKQEKRKIQL